MTYNFTKDLDELIRNAGKKLDEAQNARKMVIDYIKEHYSVDDETIQSYEYLEDECTWCYGIDADTVESLIEKVTGIEQIEE